MIGRQYLEKEGGKKARNCEAEVILKKTSPTK
jgi:hypothetical protein